MARVSILLGVITFVVWVYTLVKVATTPGAPAEDPPEGRVGGDRAAVPAARHGGLVRLRPAHDGGAARRSAHERATPAFPEYDRPGRAAATDPEKDEEFLRQVRERAEEQRKRYEQSKKEQPEEPTPDV